MDLPQFLQNRAVSGFLFPQAMQNMEAGFYHLPQLTTNPATVLTISLQLYRGAIGQHLRHALHHFVGIIAHR